tara:strand:+ start:370 stop:534 length:165 start_codon:yes stop_codon:yes gene_type:complete
MREYIFYSRLDTKKEIIGRTTTLNKHLAVEKFAIIKKLNVKEFTKLFRVEEEKR